MVLLPRTEDGDAAQATKLLLLRKPFELVIVPGESELAQQKPAIYKTKIT
jgi:hypothetical protein